LQPSWDESPGEGRDESITAIFAEEEEEEEEEDDITGEGIVEPDEGEEGEEGEGEGEGEEGEEGAEAPVEGLGCFSRCAPGRCAGHGPGCCCSMCRRQRCAGMGIAPNAPAPSIVRPAPIAKTAVLFGVGLLAGYVIFGK
jgi:hypothetical protein